MSYDLRIAVKVEGLENKYINIGSPELDCPTYNLGKMFRACMDWNFEQGYVDEDNNYHSTYYNCEEIVPKIIRGINELKYNPEDYKQYEPENGWGTLQGALDTLTDLNNTIFNISDEHEIPFNCLYMCW